MKAELNEAPAPAALSKTAAPEAEQQFRPTAEAHPLLHPAHLRPKRQLATSKERLCTLLRRLILSAVIDMEQAMIEARRWRSISGKTWSSSEFAVWSRIYDRCTSARIFFRQLRENLDPLDYRAALLAARKEVSGLRQRIAAEEAA